MVPHRLGLPEDLAANVAHGEAERRVRRLAAGLLLVGPLVDQEVVLLAEAPAAVPAVVGLGAHRGRPRLALRAPRGRRLGGRGLDRVDGEHPGAVVAVGMVWLAHTAAIADRVSGDRRWRSLARNDEAAGSAGIELAGMGGSHMKRFKTV